MRLDAASQGFLLGASVLMTIPMGSVLVSRIAPHRVARWTSVGAGTVMTLVQAASLTVGTAPTLHYIYFSIIEIATTAFIVWYALTGGRSTSERTDDRGEPLDVYPDPAGRKGEGSSRRTASGSTR